MTTLATESFTGANGAPWASQWTVSGLATTDIQSNRGRIVPQPNPYNVGVGRAVLNLPFSVDQELTATFVLPEVGVEQYHYVGIRTSGTPDKNTGFLLSIFAGGYVVARGYDGANLSGDIPFTFAAGTAYRFRLRAVGNQLQARVWAASSAEPSTWGYWDDNAAGMDLTPGTVTLSAGNGAAPTSRVLLIDDLVLTDGVTPAPIFTGTLSLAGVGTQTRAGTPRTSSDVALSGTATQGRSGTPVVSNGLPLTGSGTTAQTGSPSLRDRLDLDALTSLDLDGAPSLEALVGLSGTATLRLSGRSVVARVARRADVSVPSSAASIAVSTNTRTEVRVP
jgi:hypothetical protein